MDVRVHRTYLGVLQYSMYNVNILITLFVLLTYILTNMPSKAGTWAHVNPFLFIKGLSYPRSVHTSLLKIAFI
jgi:hypothetical protein